MKLVKQELSKNRKKSPKRGKHKAKLRKTKDDEQEVQNKSKSVTPIKSPSADSIYRPMLSKNQLPRRMNPDNTLNVDFQTELASFIKNMRIISDSKTEGHQSGRDTTPSSDAASNVREYKEQHEKERTRDGREAAQELILEAERHKASILPNPGKDIDKALLNHVDPNNTNHLQDDGEYMHVTCHVDEVTKGKIRRGEFVELIKLWFRHKDFKRYGQAEQKMELINKQGRTYFAPAEESSRINGIRQWEQAFRVYATIYAQANPHRAHEIFQYINIITEAAKSYTWECIAYYDFTFRKMMADKPNRSWAKSFPELWTQSMTEPLQRNSNNDRFSNNKGKKDWRDYCCWRFNKSVCRHGPKCRFEHKCNYCGSKNHPVMHCPRLSNRGNQGRDDDEKRSGKSKRRHERSDRGHQKEDESRE